MSLFNPYVWLGFVLAIAAAFGVGYQKGGEAEYIKQLAEIAKLNSEARQKEQALVSAVTTQATQLVKANNDAKLAQQKRNSDLDSGALRLRIPVKTICPAIPTSSSTAVASGDSVQTTAELDRETAKALVAITDQGDANTRQLNACIDAYSNVFNALNNRK